MMWSILLISLLALKGGVCNLLDDVDDVSFLGEVSNSAACDNVGYVQMSCMSQMRDQNVMIIRSTTAEQLDQSCPQLLKYIDCVEDTLKLCSDLDRAVIIAKSQVGILRDLCDKDSDLRKGYLEMAPCYGGLKHYYPIEERCIENGDILSEAYFNSSLIQVEIGKFDKKRCFTAAYETACATATVDRVCGADAGAVLIEITARGKTLEGMCPRPYIEEVKGEFFQFLKNEFDNLDSVSAVTTEVGKILIIDEPKSPGMEKAFNSL